MQASDGNLAGTLSGSSLAGAAATAATATSQLTAPAPLANPPAARPADQQPATAADAAEAAQEDGQQMPEDQLEDEEQDDDEEQHLQQRPRARSTRRQQQAAGQTRANALDPTTLDPRRAKRILANRQSAQRSRMKRLQYIHDLENRSAATSATVKELQAEVERLQEQQAGLAESVEARKVQVGLHASCKCVRTSPAGLLLVDLSVRASAARLQAANGMGLPMSHVVCLFVHVVPMDAKLNHIRPAVDAGQQSHTPVASRAVASSITVQSYQCS